VGAEQVESARSTMHDIVECIGQVSGLVEQITQASELQSSGLVDATQAVHTMDSATQQNATLVEETAAAAESLRTQAQRLVQVVSRFRLTPA
ncbi:MAG TPA: methyl-accepting chemotaxis protein, partial [Aquabacterium sp.]|nr:methyl-accepting chemotaxis protein [Aquabacterium sp.]